MEWFDVKLFGFNDQELEDVVRRVRWSTARVGKLVSVRSTASELLKVGRFETCLVHGRHLALLARKVLNYELNPAHHGESWILRTKYVPWLTHDLILKGRTSKLFPQKGGGIYDIGYYEFAEPGLVEGCPGLRAWSALISQVPERWFDDISYVRKDTPLDDLPFESPELQHLTSCDACSKEAKLLLSKRSELRRALLCPSTAELVSVASYLNTDALPHVLANHVKSCAPCRNDLAEELVGNILQGRQITEDALRFAAELNIPLK